MTSKRRSSKNSIGVEQAHAELIALIKSSGKFKREEPTNKQSIQLLMEFTKVVPSDSQKVEQISHNIIFTKSGIVDALYSPNNCYQIKAYGEIYIDSSGNEVDYRIRFDTNRINKLRLISSV